ncbi:MAG: hypothetical protein ACOYON_03090 [Fimbriimonas sp.]
MFSSGGPKQYPYLARYLEQDQKRAKPGQTAMWPVAFSVFAGTALFALLRSMNVAGGEVYVALAAVIGISAYFFRRNNQRKVEPTPQEIAAQEAKARLHLSLTEKRLNLDAPAPVATLLEESARHWSRIDAALKSPAWNAANLPEHYVRARHQARAAADLTMDEIIVTLEPTILSLGQRPDWRDAADNVVKTVFRPPDAVPGPRPLGQEIVQGIFAGIFQRGNSESPLPPEFYPAQQLAEKLRDLAVEVEATKAGVGSLPQAPPRVESTLETALTELRSIREAEDELRENLRAGN